METWLIIFILLPVLGFLISLIMPDSRENLVAWSAFGTLGIHLNLAVLFVGWWLIQGMPVLHGKEWILYETTGYTFFLTLYFDRITAAYLLVGSLLIFLVMLYSKTYLHREAGYKRYFNTTLLFFSGFSLAIFAGNFETLFMGWEILGISSFLLISFYRNRYLPVKNAVKIFSIYRIGDVGILLAMWMSHHLWHENITFLKLGNDALVSHHLEEHSMVGAFVSLALLVAAAAKSAQLPFSSWLPRAMEGPTPSSAIFYGSLAVHMGVFLMLRTFPFWEHQASVRVLVGLMGLTTALVASGIARVQSSIKSQIAYASIAQIGLMFIELALGFRDLVLLHVAGNAFLRTYQLLVSPSAVTYLIREQFYSYSPNQRSLENWLPCRLRNSLYLLSLKEWNLDSLMYRTLWNPLKWLGHKLDFLDLKRALLILLPIYAAGLMLLWQEDHIPASLHTWLPELFALIGLLAVLKSFVERKKVRLSLALIVMNHFWIALAISFNEKFEAVHTLLYLSGIVLSGAVGWAALHWLKKQDYGIDLDQFHGHVYQYPRTALLFFLAAVGLTGFPITPTAIGEDLLFSHIHENQMLLATFVSLSLIIDGLAAIRIYARVFLGPHVKTYHEVAHRSS